MITRRMLLSMFAAIPGLAHLATQTPRPEPVGPMSLERERRLASRGVKVRVMVDGVDVTNRCQFADDTPGHQVACLLKHDSNGRCYFDRRTGDAARETTTGDVRIMLERKA